MTDRRPRRRSPAWRAKIAAAGSSATAVLAIVAGLMATAQKQEAVQTQAPGGAAEVPSADAGPPSKSAPVTAVPVPVPAAGPAGITATPDGVSRASGG